MKEEENVRILFFCKKREVNKRKGRGNVKENGKVVRRKRLKEKMKSDRDMRKDGG